MWTEWSTYSPCHAACGRSFSERVRYCTKVITGGQYCHLHRETGVKTCESTDYCKVNFFCSLSKNCKCYGLSTYPSALTWSGSVTVCENLNSAILSEIQANQEDVFPILTNAYPAGSIWITTASETQFNGANCTSASILSNSHDNSKVLTYEQSCTINLPFVCSKDFSLGQWSPWSSWLDECDGSFTEQRRKRSCVSPGEKCASPLCTGESILIKNCSCCTTNTEQLQNMKMVAGCMEISCRSIFQCIDGYKASTNQDQFELTCLGCTSWMPIDITCEKVSCQEASELAPQHGFIIGTSLGLSSEGHYNDWVAYQCDSDHSFEDGSSTIISTCMLSGEWSQTDLPRCVFMEKTWHYFHLTDTCYILNNKRLSYEDAQTDCSQLQINSSLVSILSPEELVYVTQLLLLHYNQRASVWISNMTKEFNAGDTNALFNASKVTTRRNYMVTTRRASTQMSSSVSPFHGCRSYVAGTRFQTTDCLVKMKSICRTDPDSVKGAWSVWSEWTACSVNTKSRQRHRQCNNPAPACTGLTCDPPAVELARCCGDPGYGLNAFREMVDDAPGEIATYHCYDGFVDSDLSLTKNLTCLSSGSWSDAAPICARVSCDFNLYNGFHSSIEALSSYESWHVGDVVRYICDDGYVVDNAANLTSQSLVCLSNGTWSQKTPVNCTGITCPDIPEGQNIRLLEIIRPNNSDMTIDFENATYVGDAVRYHCLNGFWFFGRTYFDLVCQNDGTFSGAAPLCQEVTCPPGPRLPEYFVVSDANVTSEKTAVGDLMRITCQQGYSAAPVTQEIQCLENGTWSLSHLQLCEVISCGDPGSGINVLKKVGNRFSFGDIIVYVCPIGYRDVITKESTSAINCTEHGRWNREAPDCEPNQCTMPLNGTNTKTATGSGYMFEDVWTYTCPSSFKIEGTQENKLIITCTVDGTWNGSSNPTCIRISSKQNLLVDIIATNTVKISFVQTLDTEGATIRYQYVFKGLNDVYHETTQFFTEIESNITGLISIDVTLKPGFKYKLWIHSSNDNETEHLEEVPPHAEFHLRSGLPSLRQGYTNQNSTPVPDTKTTENTSFNVTIIDVFSSFNGSIVGYTLIVAGIHPWNKRSYYDQTFPQQLPTWKEVSTSGLEIWYPYQASPVFSAFDGGDGNTTTRMIGNRLDCDAYPKTYYCNGELKRGLKYCVKLRVFTADEYVDSPCSTSVQIGSKYHRLLMADARTFGLAIVPYLLFIAFSAALASTVCRVEKSRRRRNSGHFALKGIFQELYDQNYLTSSLSAIEPHSNTVSEQQSEISSTVVNKGSESFISIQSASASQYLSGCPQSKENTLPGLDLEQISLAKINEFSKETLP